MKQGRKFWMVFVEGQSSPTCKHYEKPIAEGEAKRLTKMLGRTAYLLECTAGYKLLEVEEIEMLDDKDIPF